MNAKRKNKAKEWARNAILVILAVGLVVVFFNLDIMQKGESVFSREGSVKLRFQGDLGRRDYGKAEVDELVRYINRESKIMQSATLETRLQDSYRKVTDTSQVIFEIHLVMKDGTRISTPARRSRRDALIRSVVEKLDKDISAYKQLKRQGKEMKSLINTS